MPRTITLVAAIVLALAVPAAHAQRGAPPKGKKLYCWDDNGRRVCGDALPAEAAGSARTEFSARSGRRTGAVDRALSAEERAAAQAEADAAARAAEGDAARLRRELAIAQSYSTEVELQRAFQERIDMLDESLKATRLGVDGVRQSLVSLLRQAGEQELAGKKVPAAAATSIAHQHAELRRRQRLLGLQLQERQALDGELARVLQRYRELRQPLSASAPAQPPTGG